MNGYNETPMIFGFDPALKSNAVETPTEKPMITFCVKCLNCIRRSENFTDWICDVTKINYITEDVEKQHCAFKNLIGECQDYKEII